MHLAGSGREGGGGARVTREAAVGKNTLVAVELSHFVSDCGSCAA